MLLFNFVCENIAPSSVLVCPSPFSFSSVLFVLLGPSFRNRPVSLFAISRSSVSVLKEKNHLTATTITHIPHARQSEHSFTAPQAFQTPRYRNIPCVMVLPLATHQNIISVKGQKKQYPLDRYDVINKKRKEVSP